MLVEDSTVKEQVKVYCVAMLDANWMQVAGWKLKNDEVKLGGHQQVERRC